MGNYLKTLQSLDSTRQEWIHFLEPISLTKLMEYFGIFKSISETYSIDAEQFNDLFKTSDIDTQQLFECLDTDHNLLIDGLQLFSALAIFSHNIVFIDKIKFLFQLFDFNQLRSLSRTDIEFLVLSACTAVSKLLYIPQEDNFIQEFVHQEFNKDKRVNLSEIIKWARKSDSVSSFFALIGRPFEISNASLLSQKIYLTLPSHRSLQSTVINRLNADEEVFIQKSYKLLKQNMSEDEIQPLSHIKHLQGHPSWIYGIRFRDVRQFVEVEDDEIIYFVGKTVILYECKAHSQRFYNGHQHQIISLAVQGTLCASGEYGLEPSIKIWSRTTLSTLNTLKIHTQGVHLLMFMNGLLISLGCHEESPLFINEVESGATLYSTYCKWPAVDISAIYNFTNKPTLQFVVGTIRNLTHFQILKTEEGIQVVTSSFEQEQRGSRITCICFLLLNSTFPTLRSYDDHTEKLLLTGHQNGQVWSWNLQTGEKLFNFGDQSCQIVKMVPSNNKLYIASHSSLIKIYKLSTNVAHLLSTLDFTQINQDLSSYDLIDLKIKGNGLLAITDSAQFVIIQDQQGNKKPTLSNLTHHQYAAQKIKEIVKIEGPICHQQILKKEKEELLYISELNSIKTIDLAAHCFCLEWNLGQPVAAFDCILTRNQTILIVAAVEIGLEESMLCSFSELTENVGREKIPGQVISVLLQTDQNPTHILVLVSTRNAIFKYQYARGNFSKAGFLQLASISPLLSPFESNRLLVSSKENTLQTLLLNRQQQQMHIQSAQSNSLISSTPIKVYFQLDALKQLAEVLPIIVSYRSKALVGCRCDGSIDLWRNWEELVNQTTLNLKAHSHPVRDLSFHDDQRYLISAGGQDNMIVQWRILFRSEINSATSATLHSEQIEQKSDDKQVQRKIQFCMFGNDLLDDIYDQHLHISGLKHESIKRLFKSTLNEWRSNYRNMEPSIKLKLDFVFGIQTFHKNHTIKLLDNPKRIVYFVGKIVVIYNPALNNQQFYRGHKYKVTCLALLSNQHSAVTGEAAFKPVINQWHIATLETIRVISTCHFWGILDLSVCDNFLLSYGFRERKEEDEEGIKTLYSFELHDLEFGRPIARGQEQKFVYSFQIDPSNPLCFASCTDGLVTFWQAKASNFRRVNICPIPQDTPTVCLYYQQKLGKGSSQPDLLIGTRSGSLGIVSRQKYWYCFQREQRSGQVNCLLTIEQVQGDETLIVASSEDNMVRVWNSSFEERLSQCLAKQDQNEEIKKDSQSNRSLQSLCLLNAKELRVVGGTRNGEVVQLWLGKPGNKGRDGEETVLLRFSSGDGTRGRGRVLIAHHPKIDVLASVGEDQVVIFWQCDRKKVLLTSELGLERERTRPTALKFSHNGDFLIIGFSDGLLVFLDSKMTSMAPTKGDQKYSQPTLKTIVKEKCEEGWTIVAIEISERGEYMAVSYHKLNKKKSNAEVKIYASKLNAKVKPLASRFENQKIYELHSIVDNPHLDHVYQTASGGPCGFAVVSMTFAEYEGSHYLLMLFQLVDQQQSKIGGTQIEEDLKYKIRHVNNKTDSANSSSLNELIRWKKSQLLTALSAQYLLEPTSGTKSMNNHLHIPHFAVSNVLEGHLALASDNGDLHLLPVQSVEAGGVATTNPGHSCRVAQLEYNHNHDKPAIYSTGEYDHSILRWVVEPSHNLLPQHFQEDNNDLFAQIPQEEYLLSRQTMYHQNFIRPVLPHPASPLRLHNIIGRKAYGIRNNLKADQKGRIIYHSGHAVVIADLESKKKEFLFERGRTLEEVSTIVVSENGQLLVAAYGGVRSAIVLWGLSSKLQLGQIYLENVLQVVYMTLSHNNNRLLIYTLRGKNAEGCLMLLDLTRKQLEATATYLLKPNWHIKAMIFQPNCQDKFFTCGVEPVKSWHLHSGQLIYTPLSYPDPTRIHTCIAYAGEHRITGTDQGQIILWRGTVHDEESLTLTGHDQTQKVQHLIANAHQQMVTCLAVAKSEKGWLIVSGSQASFDEGLPHQVVVWELFQGELKQIQQVIARRDVLSNSMFMGRGSRYESELEVQSLSFNENRINIGLLRGDIYSCQVFPQGARQPIESKLEMALQDGQCTKALFFAEQYHQMIDISEHGLLRLWTFPEGTYLWNQLLEGEVVDMVFCSQQSLILIGFRGQLRFFGWGEGRKTLEEIQEKALQFNFLTHLVLNHAESLLALGIQSNSDHSHLIEVYQLGVNQFRLRLKLRFDSPIDYIDFNKASNQKNFILIKTQSRLELYDLNTLSEVSHVLALKLDWLGPGLQVVQKTKKARQIHKELSGDLPIKKISQIPSGTLIVDVAGDVYLFKEGQLMGKSNMRMSGAESVAVCSSGGWVGVSSRWDRNIVIWDLHPLKF